MNFCSVCLDVVVEGGPRSTARLTCGHSFHLDCIGSAFNAKGRMQCPNCRGVEQGRWLYTNACCLKEDPVEDLFEQEPEVYSELQLNHMPWCPHHGTYQHISQTFEELMSLGHGYADSLHERWICPYLLGVHSRSNHTENHMGLRLYHSERSLSYSGSRGASRVHQVGSAPLTYNGSWVPYGGSVWSRNQNVPNLHSNHRHRTSGVLLEDSQIYTRFDQGTDAGGLSSQHVHNQVNQMIQRYSHLQSEGVVRNGQMSNMRARNGEVSRRTRHSHNYRTQNAQISEPMHAHPSWGGPYSPQRASMTPYLAGVHWAAAGPQISYGVPVYWWAWAQTDHRTMASYPNHVGRRESATRTT